MNYEEGNGIVCQMSYDFASAVTGKFETKYEANPLFDTLYEKASERLWEIIVEEIKAGNIPKE